MERAIVGQLWVVLRSPEIVVATWRAARALDARITETALRDYEPLAPISPALAGETIRSGNGRQTLGVDISKVGLTPTQVKRFLLGLPADAASKVRSGCTAVMGDQGNHHPKLFRFCTVLPPKSVATID